MPKNNLLWTTYCDPQNTSVFQSLCDSNTENIFKQNTYMERKRNDSKIIIYTLKLETVISWAKVWMLISYLTNKFF